MPWTEQRYPAAMRQLPPVVRNKVIEIRIAISKGKPWAEHHGGRTP